MLRWLFNQGGGISVLIVWLLCRKVDCAGFPCSPLAVRRRVFMFALVLDYLAAYFIYKKFSSWWSRFLVGFASGFFISIASGYVVYRLLYDDMTVGMMMNRIVVGSIIHPLVIFFILGIFGYSSWRRR